MILDADGDAGRRGRDAPRRAARTPRSRRWPQAGDRARGGTAVVTLEPCNHTGRTGPCAEALIAAGVARVVVAVADPTPLAAGGADTLRAAGVDVELGVDAGRGGGGRARGLAAPASASTGPFVIWKFAATLDGRIGRRRRHQPLDHRRRGRAPTCTGCAPRCDAIVVGSGTVLPTTRS